MHPALRAVHPSTVPKQQGGKAEALQYKKPASLTVLKTVGYPKGDQNLGPWSKKS